MKPFCLGQEYGETMSNDHWKAKFHSGFDTSEPVNLWLGVSLDNPNLQGTKLLALINLVNRHHKMIKKLYIVVGDQIHGRYIGQDLATKLGDQWLSKATQYLNKETLKFDFEIKRWNDITDTESYKQYYAKALEQYKTDSTFQKIVDDVATEFATKKKYTKESAVDYIIDECAAYATFDGKTTYPARTFNPAIDHFLTVSQVNLEYVGYGLSRSVKQDKDPDLHKLIQKQNEQINFLTTTILKLQEIVMEKHRYSSEPTQGQPTKNTFF